MSNPRNAKINARSADIIAQWIRGEDTDMSQEDELPQTCQQDSYSAMEKSTDLATGPSDDLIANGTFTFRFIKGDGVFHKEGFPEDLRRDIKLHCEEFSTDMPSCFRAYDPRSPVPGINVHGNPAPFVNPVTNEVLDAADFKVEGHYLKILVVRGKSGSSWRRGKAAILVNFSKKRGTRTLWHVWDAVQDDETIKFYAQTVEKAVDNSFEWLDGEMVYRKRNRADKANESVPIDSHTAETRSSKKRKRPSNNVVKRETRCHPKPMPLKAMAESQAKDIHESSEPFSSVVNFFNNRVQSALNQVASSPFIQQSAPSEEYPIEPQFVFTYEQLLKGRYEPLSDCLTINALFGQALYHGTAHPATYVLQVCITGEQQPYKFRKKDNDEFQLLVNKLQQMSHTCSEPVVAFVTALDYVV